MLTAPLTIRQPDGAPSGPSVQEGARPSGGTAGRLAWLDALRGVAALIVALHHASESYIPGWQAAVPVWLDPGKYGVLVFFLVSGYVIPASLERRGSLRGFWIGRLFRIYPLLLVACLVGLLPYLLGDTELRPGLEVHDPTVATLAHLTMLQDLLGVPNMLNVLWTLSYEMAFYLLVAGLFVAGVHRRSASVALSLAVAMVSVSVVLPASGFSKALGIGPVVIITFVVLVVAITASLSGRRRVAIAGGVLGGLLGALLAGANGRVSAWEGLTYLALMFAGTAFYRAEVAARALRERRADGAERASEADQKPEAGRRSERRRDRLRVAGGPAALVCVPCAGVAAVALNAHLYVGDAVVPEYAFYWAVVLSLATGTFVVAWSLRRRRMPRALSTLGRISFSVYLLHPVLLIFAHEYIGISGRNEPVQMAAFMVVLIVLSLLSHRWIEEPGQRLGRRLTRRHPAVLRPPSAADSPSSAAGQDTGDSGGDGRRQHPARSDQEVGEPLVGPSGVEGVLLAEVDDRQ